MTTAPVPPSADKKPPAKDGSGPGLPVSGPEMEGDRPPRSRWHPGVPLTLILVVLLPLLSTGILVGSKGASGWTFRQKAQVVATDASGLQTVASARAELNSLVVPLSAVSYASSVGVSESALDGILKPTVPYAVQLAQGTDKIDDVATFSSTPVLRADVARLHAIIPRIAADTVTYATVHSFVAEMATDVNDLWYKDYGRLQQDIDSWEPPGSFEVHATALRQTYAAFLAADDEAEGSIYVLEGTGPSGAKTELIQGTGTFQTATSEFAGQLGPKAQAEWAALQRNQVNRRFHATIQQALSVALGDLPAPFVGNLSFAGSSERPALQYVTAFNALVVAASQDLQNSALAQASDASHRFIDEILFLLLLGVVTVGGVIVASRALTRPLRTLASQARQVQGGDFDLERLPDRGPREVVTATAAFNEMASTLKAVESTAVALAAEDIAHPESFTALPGRTGHALQASVDALASRIREREVHRALLQEAATHDRLTGLLNRAAVLDSLTNDVSRRIEQGETVAVLFVDLDGLKLLNDEYGHEAGDNAIRVTAQALLKATSLCDVVGRLGGDEFLIVLCHEHSAVGNDVADRIRRTVAEHSIPVQGFFVPLQASVGVALTRCDSATDPMRLVHEADQHMYEAKKAARALRDMTSTS
jgi:diguanylate cyclase (GGDEF)-like protein